MTMRAEHRKIEGDDRIFLVTNETGRVEKMVFIPAGHWQQWEGEGRTYGIDITDHWEGLSQAFRGDNSIGIAREIEELAYDIFGGPASSQKNGEPPADGQKSTGPVSAIMTFLTDQT